MKRNFTFLMAAFALMAFFITPMGMNGQTRTETTVLTLDCASPAPTGSTSTALNTTTVAEFLNSAAGLSQAQNKITCSEKTGDVYKGKGSGGGNIPQQCLKVGKASGGGGFTFTIPDNYENIDVVEITCYGWKTTSSISINSGTAQTFTTAQSETIKTFELASSTRTITISVTTSAVCITEIVLKKNDSGSTPTTYTVTYNANVTGVSPIVDTYDEGDEVTLRGDDTFTNEGYTFEEWNTQADGDGDGYVAGDVIEDIQEDIELYAIWTENTTPSGETLTFDFEDNTAHRTSGNNSYTGTNTYTENGVTISLTYADAVTSGTPISGTANFMGRVAKNTTNSPSMIIGPIDMQNWASVSKVAFKTNGSSDITEKFFISIDGTNYTEVLSFSLGSTTSNKTADNLDITGNQLYLKWTGAVAEVNTTSNRDFRIDDIVITYTVSAVTTPALTVSPNSLNGFEYVYNYGPSQAQTISISGSYLSDNVILAFSNAANSDFEMSTDNTNWQSTNITLTPNNGTLAETNVYVRLKSGKAVNSYSDQLSVSSTGATSTSMNLSGTVAQLMTVAQAMTAIDNASGNTVSNAYVHGYVCQIDNYSSNRITYWISDDGLTATKLEVYNGYGLNGANFTSINDLTVGDEVVVYGNLTLYNSSVYEFSAGSRLVSHVHNVIPIINAANTMNMNYNHTAGEIAYTITNSVQGESLTATTDATWITNISVLSDKVTIYTTENDEQQARTATITLSYEGAINKTVTVTQGVYTPGATGAEWVLTDLADLTANDVFVIVGTIPEGSTDDVLTFAMPHSNGTSSAPVVVEVTIENDKITSTVDASIQWNISGDATGYTFCPNGDSQKWMYCTDNNDGIRVGTNTDNEFTFVNTYDEDHPNQGYYLFNTAVERYVGIYITSNGSGHAQDWRCYQAAYNNIKNQSFAFYKRVDVQPESYYLDITGYNTGNGNWYLIASPVEGVTPTTENGFIQTGEGKAYDLYRFDQSQELEWLNYKVTPFNLISGHGYLYASKTNTQLKFAGTPYSGNGQVTLSYSTANSDPRMHGMNLVGNPFPEDAAYIDRDFYTVNPNSNEFMVVSRAIEPMEGAIVKTSGTQNETMTFSTTPPANNSKKLALNLSQGHGILDRAIVHFEESQPLTKLQMRDNSTSICIPMDGVDYASISAENQGEMPINFKAEENGTYTLSFNAEDVELNYLHLFDNMTGNDVDLLANPSYTFEAKKTDYRSRFKLVFATGNNSNDDTFAFYSSGNWVITNEGEATLQVVDVTGRIVSSEAINGCANININAANGVYMLRLVNGNNVKTQKIVVK